MTEAGDDACWMHRVCDVCGAIVDERNGHRPECELAAPPAEEDAAG